MDKQEIIDFFDSYADTWDAGMVRNEKVITDILDSADIKKGESVLDVACGTGVLIPDYIKRGASFITGIDISPKMAEIAKSKFEGEKVRIICGDVEETVFNEKFDRIMVYNAFSHFPNPEKLISALVKLLNENGILCVAHSMSRDALKKHHSGSAKRVSTLLPEAEELAVLFAKYLDVTHAVSNEEMYMVCGKNCLHEQA